METSESFHVLEEEDSEGEITEDWTSDFRKNQTKKEYVKRILAHCGRDDGNSRPLHVAIIGTHGVGKSAFVNTIAAALGEDRWREYAYSGSYGSGTGGITVFTTSFPKCCKSQQFKEQLLPTLIDIAGFDDHHDEGWTELLRIVFYGRLPVGESLAEAEQWYREKGLEGLRSKYSQNNEALKVDRVIVLSSALTEAPDNLIRCVLDAARPSGTKGKPKRTIPIYGVMLKHDKVVSKSEFERRKTEGKKLDVVDEESYMKRESHFISSLGLVGSEHRFLRCSNYCDDVDKENRRVDTVIPDLDLPVLKFFVQVTDPVFEVINADEKFTDTHKQEVDQPKPSPEVAYVPTAQVRKSAERERKRIDPKPNPFVENFGENFVSIMMISFEALLVAFILYFVTKPQVDMGRIKGICRAQAGKPGDQLAEICRDINDVSSAHHYSFLFALMALIIVRVGFTMATMQLFKRER